jgi:two-component system nitrogen regulation sensor histidine kinase NtrY
MDNPRTVSSRLVLVTIAALAASGSGATALILSRALGPPLGWPLALLAATAVGLLVLAWPLARWLRALARVRGDIERFAKGDFSPVTGTPRGNDLGALSRSIEMLGESLRQRQLSSEQSERLLHTLMDATPTAVLLFEDAGQIKYANDAARTLFFEGKAVEGANFLAMLAAAPEPFREAVLCDHDRLFSVNADGTDEIYHLAKRHFEWHGNTHTLLMVKHMTREVRRQEIDVWKKLVRVVSHELNNSLAPIKSLVHSARIMTHASENPKLERVFSTIDERATHLQGFVEGYAKFARLPSPRKQPVDLREFLGNIGTLTPYARITSPPGEAAAHFDRSQLEQVLINLLKNAHEAGGPEDGITLVVSPTPDEGVLMVVADRGPGMSPDVLESAMLPFFSTKAGGSGLGLAICREIVDAHGVEMRMENRQAGGLAVTLSLPGPTQRKVGSRARLTLSRV